MKVGELYDVVENTRFQVVKNDPITWKETIVFDNRDETMCEEELSEQVANATVEAAYSYFDYNEDEIILQVRIF